MFDEHVGLGEIIVHNRGILTTQKISFHCVNISNGSRRIALEERVGFVAHFHPMGRFEAIEIEPLTGFVDFGGAPMF